MQKHTLGFWRNLETREVLFTTRQVMIPLIVSRLCENVSNRMIYALRRAGMDEEDVRVESIQRQSRFREQSGLRVVIVDCSERLLLFKIHLNIL